MDVVISGHVHAYARTCNVYKEECIKDKKGGTTHITLGTFPTSPYEAQCSSFPPTPSTLNLLNLAGYFPIPLLRDRLRPCLLAFQCLFLLCKRMQWLLHKLFFSRVPNHWSCREAMCFLILLQYSESSNYAAMTCSEKRHFTYSIFDTMFADYAVECLTCKKQFFCSFTMSCKYRV